MKRKLMGLTLACILLLGCTHRYPDYSSGSGFDRTEIDSLTLENLEVLGRVWGFVKYHHPVFSDNKYDLDFELFNLLPRIADVEASDRNRILVDWIDGFGTYKTNQEHYDKILSSDSPAEYHTDIDWISDADRLGQELSERLITLRLAEREGNYYVGRTVRSHDGKTFQIENPCFNNEKPYTQITNPDYGYRLLTVFRFWNMIEYYFPTKHLTDKDWNDVLPEYIARMVQPVDGDYRKETWRIIAEINDNHAQWNRTELFGEHRVPLNVGFVENKLIISSPDTIPDISYERLAPFEVGDEIVAVAGKPVDYYISHVREFVPCSNENDILAATADIILRSKNNRQLRVDYTRDGVKRDTLVAGMERMPYTFQNTYITPGIDSHKLLDNSIGYIYPAKYDQEHKYAIKAMLGKTKGLVIDLRCYPNYGFSEFVSSYILVDNAGEDYAIMTSPTYSLPGEFFKSFSSWPEIECQKYEGNISVIVNESTQSYAETTVQLFQTNPNVRVIGTCSAGANGNISNFTLPGGIECCFTGLGWHYPDGWCVQRQGVKIDIEAKATIEGIKAGRDEMLEAAIELLK